VKARGPCLILDEPTTLPDGTAVDLGLDDEGNDFTDDERRALQGDVCRYARRRDLEH
jgi:hypothetical protein